MVDEYVKVLSDKEITDTVDWLKDKEENLEYSLTKAGDQLPMEVKTPQQVWSDLKISAEMHGLESRLDFFKKARKDLEKIK